jgi:hypothetical protein
MAIDLFTDDLRNVSGAELYASVEVFIRVSEETTLRPREGYVLDFKESWNDAAIQTVAAFAHTFGGLLIIGVPEKDGVPEHLTGVATRGELKTAIASSIATNISPTPPYEIAECQVPNAPGKKIAIIKVRQGQELYFYTKKNSRHSIFVRNEDQTVPADAAQLRALIERRLNRSVLQSDLGERFNFLADTVGLQDRDSYGQAVRPTNFMVRIAPFEKQSLSLDSYLESEFRKLISQNFVLLQNKKYGHEDRCDTNWYLHRWFRDGTKFEAKWQITSAGDVGYAIQINFGDIDGQPVWSLGDRIADLIWILRTAASFWNRFGFFGQARIVVDLDTTKLSLYRDEHLPRFPLLYRLDLSLDGTAVELCAKPTAQGHASLDLNFAMLSHDLGETISNLLNQLLRSMGHSADMNSLRNSVNELIERLPE